MQPVEATKYTFEFIDSFGTRCRWLDFLGDMIFEDSVIAHDLETARQHMANGYGPDVVHYIRLVSEEPIVLYGKDYSNNKACNNLLELFIRPDGLDD